MEALLPLLLATLTFVVSHFALSSRWLRPKLLARLGEGPFRLVYSVIALASLVWLLEAYRDAPFLPLWPAGAGFRWIAVLAMPAALILLVGSLTPANPTLLIHRGGFKPAAPGIFAITRHPMMWGIALFSALHILATGDGAALIAFGGLALLALGGTLAIDARKRRTDPAGWAALAAATSNLPFRGPRKPTLAGLAWPLTGGLAAYVLLLLCHRLLIGVSALP